MADTFLLRTTVKHELSSADDFFGTDQIRDTIQAYVATKPEGSFVRFVYDEDPMAAAPFRVTSLLHIEAESIGDIATAITQIDNNLSTLTGTAFRRHAPEIEDAGFGG